MASTLEVCPKCQGALERDECASEEVLVCQNCGDMVQGVNINIDMRREYTQHRQPTTAVSTQSQPGSIAFKCQNEIYGKDSELPKPKRDKRRALLKHIEVLADKMRLQLHQKELCIAKIDEIIRLDEINHIHECKFNETLAACVVFLFATDNSQLSLNRIQSHVRRKPKHIKKLLCKMKLLPSLQLNVPSFKDAKSVFTNHIESLDMKITPEEWSPCLEMSEGLWKLLQETSLQSNLLKFNPGTVCSIILLSLEYIRKTRNEHLEEVVAKALSMMPSTFNRQLGRVRGYLFKLSKGVPALDIAIESGSLSVHSIVRYIPTLLQNHNFISSNVQDLKAESVPPRKRDRGTNPQTGVPCVPLLQQFSCPVDDSESLLELDVDQYLATEDEIKTKLDHMESMN